MAKGVRIKLGLKCEECGHINYTTTKNPKTYTEKFAIKKFCPNDNKHTIHKETKLKFS
jgi:large subunit ribosomal protein L33